FTDPPVFGFHSIAITVIVLPGALLLAIFKYFLMKSQRSPFLSGSVFLAFCLLAWPGLIHFGDANNLIFLWMGVIASILIPIQFFIELFLYFKQLSRA
ncbi:MAG: hypothetical protein KDC44_20705, partial [Phaeodactylibacter sp.]|nr:hypothetical protein [Phaeodactylibacter sp.]